MAGTAESSNDTKTILDIAKDLAGSADDLKDLSAKLVKAAAEIKKKPEECKDPAGTARGILTALAKMSRDFDDLNKRLAKAVVK